MLILKRVYDRPYGEVGAAFLVERLWPRGVRKTDLPIRAWLKDVGPSTELRTWFDHDPDKWQTFVQRYRAELDARPEAWAPIAAAEKAGETVTLFYSSKDQVHNNAVALLAYLQDKRDTREEKP